MHFQEFCFVKNMVAYTTLELFLQYRLVILIFVILEESFLTKFFLAKVTFLFFWLILVHIVGMMMQFKFLFETFFTKVTLKCNFRFAYTASMPSHMFIETRWTVTDMSTNEAFDVFVMLDVSCYGHFVLKYIFSSWF